MNLAKLLDYGILAAAAGGIPAMLCELASLIWQFYYVHLAAGLCFTVGLLTGTGYAVYRRADRKRAARKLDSFGLKERMITACEQMDSEDEFARMQRQDALAHYNQMRAQIRIPLLPDKRHILAFLLSIAVVVGMACIPSPIREQAKLRHQVKEAAKEELEKLEELLDALEGADVESLTEEQRKQLQELTEMLKLSQEELANADSWESLVSAAERLDYKYEQTAQSLNRLASQLADAQAAGIASAEALARAAANEAGFQTSLAGTTGTGSGNGSQDGEGGDGTGGSGDGDGQGDGSGDGSGNGNGSGGSGEGNGQSGSGQGSGNGNGSGDGNGDGRGTGSSNTLHDYVSIPNAVAEDPSLTGDKNGDEDSEYYRQQNGLAWEGSHVDYNSVIGEYTEDAYEGLANGKYPEGMESVIRDYFENLNE